MISICVPYFDNPTMLREQFAVWRSYDSSWANLVDIVVVDDCSEESPAFPVFNTEFMPPVRSIALYRVNTPIPWNQDGARNLAMKVCPPGWTLCHDIDHAAPANAIERILTSQKERGTFYVPQRFSVNDKKTLDPHPNTYIIHTDDYWLTGGMDEDLCGWWGSDSFFRRQLRYKLREESSDARLAAFTPDVVADCNTRAYGRRKSEYSLSRRMPHPRTDEYVAQNPLRFRWKREF